MPDTQFPDYPAFDGSTYGESHSFEEDTGNFRRDPRNKIRTVDGPRMVAEHLIRVLKTPVGDDPIRPDFGLDKQKLLGTTENQAKYAIVEAIGPDAIPWVEQLGLDNIEITRPDGTRNADITVRPTLADGTTTEFAVAFDNLTMSTTAGTSERRRDATAEYLDENN